MKKLLILFVAIATLMNVACENSISEGLFVEQMAEISVVAEADAEEDSRVALNGNTTSWEAGDRITLALVKSQNDIAYTELEIVSPSDISSNGKRATFRGSAPEGNYLRVMAIYPAVANPSANITLDREAEKNLYMESYSSNELTITAGSKNSIPLTFSHLMHKMDFNLTLANGYDSNDLASSNIAVEVSATSYGSSVEFTKSMTLNVVQNYTSVTSKTTTILANGSEPKFSTMLFPLSYTKDVVFTFGIYIDGEKRYEIRKPESGSLSNISMQAGRSTTVNLELSKKNSIVGGEDADTDPITLKSSKTKVSANGTDSATLSVVKTNSGEDVTVQSTIYVNGSKLNGTTFTATTAGSYTLYAERNGVKSANITIVAEQSGNTGKSIVFAEGVTLNSGWYDVNKMAQGNNGDINMCWAAAASNMIQWFQDRYVAAGNSLPANAINGPGTVHHSGSNFSRTYELALMDMYLTKWNNHRGGNVEYAIPWYFENNLYGGQFAQKEYTAYPESNGGYWSSVWNSVKSNMYTGYTDGFFSGMYTCCYNNYNWTNSDQADTRMKGFANMVADAFKYGMASLTLSESSTLSSNHHAVTLWGYEIDNSTGYITRLWITDSDDINKEPKTALLNEYSVSIGSGSSHIKLTGDTKYSALYVVSIHPFAGYGSAGK